MLNKTAKDLWRPKRRIETTYKNSLKKMMKSLELKIKNLTNPHEVLKTLKKFTNSPEFNKYADATAMKIVTHLFTDAGHTWKQAARENSRGKEIYDSLKKELKGPIGRSLDDQIEKNAKIIKTLPLDISRQVTKHIENEGLKGKRASDIAEEIKEYFPQVTNAKASLIARTEVSKTSTALTKARSENMDIQWYRWRTSEDQRVRKSHKKMEDVLISWDDPPSPEKLMGEKTYGNYHAGDIFNCRCYPEPLVSMDFIKWPHKVYYGGRIQTMSKKRFLEIM